MKILILAPSKTGTTLLHSMIKNSLHGKGYKSFFEPCNHPKFYGGIQKSKKVIVKDLFRFDLEHEHDPNHWTNYDKKILLVRDPRDHLISSWMYFLATNVGYYGNTGNISQTQAKIIDIVKRKQTDPSAYSYSKFMQDCREAFGIKNPDGGPKTNVWKEFLEYINTHPALGFCIIKYEDMIKDNFENLEKYLGFSINRNQNIVKIDRVIRSKKYNNWKNWFTTEDIIIMKNQYGNLLEEFGYDNGDWELNTPQILDPKNCQDYLHRVWQADICWKPFRE